jgi:hypothetical protein
MCPTNFSIVNNFMHAVPPIGLHSQNALAGGGFDE